MERNDEGVDYSYAMRLIDYLTRTLIGEHGFTESDREDLKQDILLHVLEHWNQFDPSRGTVRTFIDRVVRNHIKNIIRSQETKKRRYFAQSISLNEPVDGKDGIEGEILDRISLEDCRHFDGSRSAFELCELKSDLRLAVSKLPQDLQHICELLKTHGISRICAVTGQDRNSVNHKIRRIRNLLLQTDLKKYR